MRRVVAGHLTRRIARSGYFVLVGVVIEKIIVNDVVLMGIGKNLLEKRMWKRRGDLEGFIRFCVIFAFLGKWNEFMRLHEVTCPIDRCSRDL